MKTWTPEYEQRCDMLRASRNKVQATLTSLDFDAAAIDGAIAALDQDGVPEYFGNLHILQAVTSAEERGEREPAALLLAARGRLLGDSEETVEQCGKARIYARDRIVPGYHVAEYRVDREKAAALIAADDDLADDLAVLIKGDGERWYELGLYRCYSAAYFAAEVAMRGDTIRNGRPNPRSFFGGVRVRPADEHEIAGLAEEV